MVVHHVPYLYGVHHVPYLYGVHQDVYSLAIIMLIHHDRCKNLVLHHNNYNFMEAHQDVYSYKYFSAHKNMVIHL